MNALSGEELYAARRVEKRRRVTDERSARVLDLLSEGRRMTTQEIGVALKYSTSRVVQILHLYRTREQAEGAPRIRVCNYLPNRSGGRYFGKGIPQYVIGPEPDAESNGEEMDEAREHASDMERRISSKKATERSLAVALPLLRAQAGNVFRVHFVWMGVKA